MLDHNFRADVGVPANCREIVVEGVRLAVADEGAGPPLICLHAIGHGGRDFEAFAAAAKDRFRVVRIDWPAQGRSGADHQALTPARYAQLVRGVVLALDLADPIIIGCSIGGAAAIDYASRFPTRALVLANSGGLAELTPFNRRACLLLSRIFAAGARGAGWYGIFFRLYYRLVLPSTAARPQRLRIVKAAYESAQTLSDAWAMFADASVADQRGIAARLAMPVLVAWCMQDRINRFSAVQPALRTLQQVRIAQFQGGHAAFLERPQQFIDEFTRFVQDFGLTAPAIEFKRAANS